VDSRYLKEAYKQDKDRLFSKACCNRTRGNGFKLKEGRQTRYREEIFYTEGGEILAQVAQRGGRCPIPAKIQGQDGQVSEQPDLVEDDPAHCRGVGTQRPLKIPSNPNYSVILYIFAVLPQESLLW